jgi:hypothetical protein
MDKITVYTFEWRDGHVDSFTTQDPVKARERGEQYGFKVIANDFEFTDSELAWDFTGT